MSVIAIPKYIEVDLLIKKYNVADKCIDKALVWEAIFEIRKAHGMFQEGQFLAVVQLLEHGWIPSDIPVLLPEPSGVLWR